jgi:flagellar basal-body rod protein FlgF
MDRFLYVGMTGANQLMLSQAVNANNLANTATTGFRADLQAFESANVDGPGFRSRVNTVIGNSGVDLSYGPLRETGRALDVAISGDGWLVVQAPDGEEVLTRAGDLTVGPGGILSTADGNYVMGDGGPLAVPPDQRVFIEPNGSVVVQTDDAGSGAVFGRLKLVNPSPGSLSKREDGLVVSTEPLVADAAVRVRSGALEQSNVNPIREMVRMIELSRLWEMNVKTMTAADDNSRQAASIAQLS